MGDLERLGMSEGFADAIAGVIEGAGFEVGSWLGFAGGWLSIASRDGLELRATGDYRAQANIRLLGKVGAYICEQRLAA